MEKDEIMKFDNYLTFFVIFFYEKHIYVGCDSKLIMYIHELLGI